MQIAIEQREAYNVFSVEMWLERWKIIHHLQGRVMKLSKIIILSSDY